MLAFVALFFQYRKVASAEKHARELKEQLAEKDRKARDLGRDLENASSRLEGYLSAAQQRKDGQKAAKLESRSGLDAKVEVLKEIFVRLPEQAIPELRLATLADWYVAVEGNLETIEDYRYALGRMRSLAEARFAKLVQPALRDFIRANNGEFPRDMMQLRELVGAEIDDEMLQRYRVVPAKTPEEVKAEGGASMGGKWQITQVSLVDSEYDRYSVIGPFGFGSYSFRSQ
ncbi:MAG TPA: hypothetical protein VGD88_04035 [Opitutaceae bacterium]